LRSVSQVFAVVLCAFTTLGYDGFVVRSSSANLDLLRAIAVLLVLGQHLLRRASVEHLLWIPTTSLGLFGVLLFFVHTCLVLMYSMERSGLNGLSLMKNFHIRRIFRIYPLSILTVLAALALGLASNVNGVAGLSRATAFPGKREIVANLLLVQNLASTQSIVNVLWSLPFELQMYLLLPFLFLWVRNRRRFALLLVLWAIGCALGTLQPRIASMHYFSLCQYLPNFLPGVIAYVLPHRPRLRALFWPLFLIALVGAYTLRPAVGTGWLLCLILGLSLPFFAEVQNPGLRWISHHIATYSYGIYLSHQFCIWVALGVLGTYSAWIRVPVLVALLISLPVLLYHAVEKPMIKLGVRLAKPNASRDKLPHGQTTLVAEPAPQGY